MQRRGTVRLSLAIGLWLGSVTLPTPLQACELKDPVRSDVSILRLTEHGDVLMSDRRIARLSGIRMLVPGRDQPDPLANDLERAVQPWLGSPVVMAAALPRTDRWGRQTAILAREDGSGDHHFALSLIRHGFAMAWPAELPPNCRILYLQAEEAARRENLGRWTQMQHRALDAGLGQEVAARAGQIAVMSGRISHIGQTRRATYLNFGARGTGASAEIGLSTWRSLERQGWTRESLRGKSVRVRGVVSEARPARLLLGDVAALEFLD